ncbi:MAG: 3-hydroxyacyl-CoA dehydrogenase NAD-binding domain-containing protein [Woeseiaceae bacterium]|jgi:enoyl-CoA hydratase/3-hydroxyacyl-CoA dehydrogenase
MTIEEIKTVCYVGAGTMGCFNALVAAVSGYDAVMHDLSDEQLEQVQKTQAEIGAFLVASGYCSEPDLRAGIQRVSCEGDLAAATSKADLVSESVIEELGVKREVHARLDRLCPERTILTTNTSGLLVSDIEDAVRRGDRFAALHSHLGSPLIDIVAGPRTSSATIDILTRYASSLNAAPLVLHKENRGYVLNAMLGPVLTMALMLVIEGGVSKEAVDAAWMKHRHAPMGPFGMMDLFGLNVVYDGWQHREADPVVDTLKPRVLAGLQPYIDRGDLGMKTGKGFYEYPNPAYERPDFSELHGDDDAPDFAMSAVLLGNAIILACNDVADPAEIDYAWTVGMSLETGPFALLDEMGITAARQLIAASGDFFSAEESRMIEHFLGQREGDDRVSL